MSFCPAKEQYRSYREEVNIIFLVCPESVAYIAERDDFSFPYIVAPNEVCEDSEIGWVESVVTQVNADAIILDGYQFNEKYRRDIRPLINTLVVVDDCNNSGALYADVVINAVNQSYQMGYALTAPNAVLMLGEQYTLLRQEFCYPVSEDYSSRSECLLTFGASDVSGLTVPVLKALLTEGDIDTISIVTGSGFRQIDSLNQLLKAAKCQVGSSRRRKVEIRVHHNVSNMRSLYEDAKFAISAAGGTLFELAATGVPSIVIVVADNQFNAAMEQQKKGWCKVFDAREGLYVSTIVASANEFWGDDALRLQMHRSAYAAATFDGAKTAASEIVSVIATTEKSSINNG